VSTPFIREEVAGLTVRFFANRKEAIGSANALTKLYQFQHDAIHFQQGWLVKNTRWALFDVDGQIPEAATKVLHTQKAPKQKLSTSGTETGRIQSAVPNLSAEPKSDKQ
jgi:hypothetical protein